MESRKANHAVPSWPRSTLNQIKWKIIFRKTTSHNSDASQSRGGGQQNWFWGYKSLRQGDGLLFLQEGLPTKPLLQQHIEICPHTRDKLDLPASGVRVRTCGANLMIGVAEWRSVVTSVSVYSQCENNAAAHPCSAPGVLALRFL